MTLLLASASLTAAVAARDDRAILRALLAAWKRCPTVPIADAVTAVSARACAGMSVPTAKTAKGRNEAWNALAVEGDPVTMGMLVATVSATTGWAETLARIELLLPHLPDPRLSAKLCDFIETPLYNVTVSRTAGFWRRLWPLLPELGDPRIFSRARGFAASWTANAELNEPERPVLARKLVAAMPALEKAYGGAPLVLTPQDLAVCATLTAARPAVVITDRNASELLAAIYANPADDAPRLVYADWLQERGDPRGEFIALQIARGTGRQTAREKDLLAEYASTWTKPLPGKKTKTKFSRGFVVATEIDGFIGNEIEWATVERCNKPPDSDDHHASSLRVVAPIHGPAFVALSTLKKPLAIEELGWARNEWGVIAAEELAAFARITCLPKLRRFTIESSRDWSEDPRLVPFAWFFAAPWTANVEELRLPRDNVNITTVLAQVAPRAMKRVEIVATAGRIAYELVFLREEAGDFGTLEIAVDKYWNVLALTDWVGAICAAVRSLPEDQLSAVTIDIPKATRALKADLEAALSRQRRLNAPTYV